MMSRKSFLLLGAAAFFLGGCKEMLGAIDQYKADFKFDYPLEPGGRLAIDNFNGSVVIQGWDQPRAEITGERYGATPEALEAVKVAIDTPDRMISIHTTMNRDKGQQGGARFTIKVPHGTTLERVISSNGRIGVSDIEGDAHLRTRNGGVQISNFKGALDARTANGRIQAQLAATAPGKPITLGTSNGGVELKFADALQSDVRVATSNGSVKLWLPPTLAARVRATTSNGSIRSEFAIAGHSSKRRVDGTIGSGGPAVDLVTSNGTISLMKAGQGEHLAAA